MWTISLLERRRGSSLRTLAALLFCALAATGALSAQQRTRELRGTVKDESGGVIVGAFVVVTSADDQERTLVTDANGVYRLTELPPGTYRLRVQLPSFGDFVATVDLRTRPTVTVDATLRVSIKEQVDVRPNDGVFSVAEPSTVTISGEELEALPDDPTAFADRLQELAGALGEAVPVRVDGFNPSGRIPPRSTIQLIRFTSNAYAAEFAQPGRGQVDIVTKPGASKFSSSVDFNFNDSTLNSRNAMAAQQTYARTRGTSGYVNGPLAKNRWGFQIYGGHWTRETQSVVNATVPSVNQPTGQPYVATVRTPVETTNVNVSTDYLFAGRQRLALDFSYTTEDATNQGLGGGLDLPDRAFGRTERTPAARAALSSVLSPMANNELRLEWRGPQNTTRAASSGAAVLVLDAFNGGANQRSLFRADTVQQWSINDRLALTRGKARFKLGLDLDWNRSRQVDESEFGGSYTFGSDFERDASGNMIFTGDGQAVPITPLENYQRTLLGQRGYGPSQLTIERGNPFLQVTQWLLGSFAQADIATSRRLSLSFGVRQTLQSLGGSTDIAPRAGFAWLIEEKARGRLRANAGLFHADIPSELLFNSMRFDGIRRQRFIISRPAFSLVIPSELPGDSVAASASTYVIADDIRTPRTGAFTIDYERGLSKIWTVALGYTTQYGVALFRLRNINAPAPGTAVKPFPDRGPILQYESTGRSTRHEVNASLRGNIRSKISTRFNYVYGRRMSDTDGASTAPANGYDLSSEFGVSTADRRHRFSGMLNLPLPWAITFSPSLNITSGRPFNLTTGRDNNGDGLFTDRPSFASPEDSGAIVTSLGAFNPNPSSEDALIPRNLGREPGQWRVDARLSKTISVSSSGGQLSFSLQGNNVLNAVNFTNLNGVVTSPYFGQPRRALDARRIDAAIQWSF